MPRRRAQRGGVSKNWDLVKSSWRVLSKSPKYMSCAWKLQKRITKLVDALDKVPSPGDASDILSTCSKSTKGMMFCSYLIYAILQAGLSPRLQGGKMKIELPPATLDDIRDCLLYTSPSPRDGLLSRMPSSA